MKIAGLVHNWKNFCIQKTKTIVQYISCLKMLVGRPKAFLRNNSIEGEYDEVLSRERSKLGVGSYPSHTRLGFWLWLLRAKDKSLTKGFRSHNCTKAKAAFALVQMQKHLSPCFHWL